jgi:hypothetical protein
VPSAEADSSSLKTIFSSAEALGYLLLSLAGRAPVSLEHKRNGFLKVRWVPRIRPSVGLTWDGWTMETARPSLYRFSSPGSR